MSAGLRRLILSCPHRVLALQIVTPADAPEPVVGAVRTQTVS